jgi:hypothetical protein
MKKPTPRKQPVLSINATLSETRLLKSIVEKLAGYRKPRIRPEAVQQGWISFYTSSIEACVSGNFDIVSEAGFSSLPFANSFVFTCIKSDPGKCDLVWGNSLS